MKIYFAQVLQSWYNDRLNTKVSPNRQKHLRTALKLHLFERLGYNTASMSYSEFDKFLSTIDLSAFAQSLEKATQKPQIDSATTIPCVYSLNLVEVAMGLFDAQFKQAVETQRNKPATRNNYRSALKSFLKWLEKQPCWRINQEFIPQITPPQLKKLSPRSAGKKQSQYGMKESNLPDPLRQKLEEFLRFRADGGDDLWRKIQRERRKEGQREGRRPETRQITSKEVLQNEKERILRFLGWQVNIEKKPIEQVQLDSLADAGLIEDYTRWLISERHSTHMIGIKLLITGVAFLKWQNFSKTRRSNWSDIDEIEDLRDCCRGFIRKYKQEHQKNTRERWEKRKLTHEQLQQICAYLRSMCGSYIGEIDPQTGQLIRKTKRTDSAIVRAWQVYLIVTILTYAPVRQQEIRQYEEQVTLFRETSRSGQTVYVARGIRDKNASRRGSNREYQLPAILTSDLDLWIQYYRPLAEQAVQSLDKWLTFSGYKLNNLKEQKQLLENAQKQAISPDDTDHQSYVERLQKNIRRIEARIATWQSTKANFLANDSLFFQLSDSHSKSFGTPLSSKSLCSMVKRAVAEASLNLFGYECYLNPHSFRHIAALHVRLTQGNKTALSCLMGHNESMGDIYAAQAQDDIAVTAMADNWWNSSQS